MKSFRATGKRPVFIGKPQPNMAIFAMEKNGFKKDQIILVGDRLYTDIACGANAGITTVFVLSGEGTLEDIASSHVKPNFVLKNIRALYDTLLKA